MNNELLQPYSKIIVESRLSGVNDSTIIEAENLRINLSLCRIVDLSTEVVGLLVHLLDSEFNKGRIHEELVLQALDELQLDDDKLKELTEIHENERCIDYEEEEYQEPSILDYKYHL